MGTNRCHLFIYTPRSISTMTIHIKMSLQSKLQHFQSSSLEMLRGFYFNTVNFSLMAKVSTHDLIKEKSCEIHQHPILVSLPHFHEFVLAPNTMKLYIFLSKPLQNGEFVLMNSWISLVQYETLLWSHHGDRFPR